jgi:ATP-dependent protease ClpP protease subunit
MSEKIYSSGNHIHFNESVSKKSILKLKSNIERANKKIASMKHKFHTSTQVPILLFINTLGGCLDSALDICNVIENNINPIVTIITGQSASAGTLMSVVGARRLIYPNSYSMVHEGSTQLGGNKKDIDVDMNNLEIVEGIVQDLYMKNTILTDAQYNKLCLDDSVWDAKMSYKYGLVDEIINSPEKLSDWNWLLNITSRKRQNIKNIAETRRNSESISQLHKKRKLSHMN